MNHLIATQAVENEQGALATRAILDIGMPELTARDPANDVPGLVEIHQAHPRVIGLLNHGAHFLRVALPRLRLD